MGHVDVSGCAGRPARRAGAARRGVVPGRRGPEGGPGGGERRGQDHAAARRHRRAGAAGRIGRAHRRARGDAAVRRPGRRARLGGQSDRGRPPRLRRPPRVREALARVDACELALMEVDDEPTQMAYAGALAELGDAGGYELEVVWDTCTTAALGVGFDRARHRLLRTLSGGEQKRLVLEYLLRGPDEVLLLDEPDNYLDVPAKIWLEQRLAASEKSVAVRLPRPRADGQRGDPRRHRRARARRRGRDGQPGLDAPGRVRVVPPGAPRPVRAFLRAHATLGGGARQAPDPGLDAEAEGDLQRRHVLALPRRPDPPAQVRGGRGRPPSSRASSRSRCGCAGGAPASAPWSARTWG